MSQARYLSKLASVLSAEGVIPTSKGGTGNTTGAGNSPTISAITYPGNDTAVNTAGGDTVTLTGANFNTGVSVIVNGVPASVVTRVSSSEITFTTSAQAAGSYIIYVVNTDGSTGLAVPGLQYSGVPSWTTAAGSLATVYETAAISNSLSASSDSAVTYSVESGTLPTGVTLFAGSGLVSGTAPVVESSTTYNFTVTASDGENQDTARNFSYTVNPDVVTWSSPSSGATLSGTVGTAYTQSLSATSAAGQAITYTADALPAGLNISGSSITGTPTAASSISTLLTATAATTQKTATRTFNWNIAAITYTITPASSSVNEGSALTFNVGGTGITNGTYYWSINNTTTAAGDFSGSVTSGSFTITSNVGSFTITATADATTEGAQTFTVSLRTGSVSGTVVATSSTVTINDTSLTPTYTLTPAASSVNEGSSLTFNAGGTNITNGTYYWSINNTTTAAGDFSASTGSFTITSNVGSFTITATADATTEGAQTFTVSLRTGSVSGTVVATSSTVTINDTSLTYIPPTQKAIFGFGSTGAMTNLVSNTGVVATDTAGVGTARYGLAAAGYGGDKAIFGYGIAAQRVSITNKVSNTGVVATDTAGVGTERLYLAAAGYGGDKAIFGFGNTGIAPYNTAITNLVSNTGVVASDTTGVGTARQSLAAAGYGGDKAIFGFGYGGAITNLVSNTGVVANDTSAVGTSRHGGAAAGYGGDKAIFGHGTDLATNNRTSRYNLVSNTGVVASDTTGVGTPRTELAAAGYGGDKAIFGYGNSYETGSTGVSITNKVSNTGVIASDTTGVGTARVQLAAAGYSST